MIIDPWSKVDYSRFTREASMVVEKLPEVIPPSDRVPGRGLLVLPILEARRRRNRGEIAKKGSIPEGFSSRGINRRKGAARGGAGAARAPLAGRGVGPRPLAAWGPPGSLWPLSGSSRSFRYADFSYIFPGIFLVLLIRGKPEIEKQQKTGTGTGVH